MNAFNRSARSYLSDMLGVKLPAPGANGVSIMDFEAQLSRSGQAIVILSTSMVEISRLIGSRQVVADIQ